MAKKAVALTTPITEQAIPAPHAEPKDGGEKDYEANSAADTLLKAHEHMQNEELMPRVHKVIGRKMKALQGIHAIKDGGFDPSTGLKGLKEFANKFGSKKDS